MKYFIVGILFITMISTANALEVAFGMGEHSFSNDNQRLAACTIAENKALKDALVKFADRQFTVTNQTRCIDSSDHAYCDYIKEIDASTSGSIKSVVDRVKRYSNNTCLIEIKAEIEPARQLNASVDSNRFYHVGDPIDINVKVGRPLYLHVLNLHADGVDILFPNQYNTNSLIDDRFTYPGQGITVKASLPYGIDQANETLLFLFTTRRQDFRPGFVTKDSLETVLESIPVNDKKLVQQHIVIKRNKK